MQSPPSREPLRQGLIYGLLAYLVWGFFPVYFKALHDIPPLEVVAHRIVWSVFFLLALAALSGRWGEVRAAFASRRVLLTLAGSTTLITVNWLVFIYAVGQGQVLQSSLGYFITPLVNVLLGMVFLRERLRPLQMISLLLAVAGVGLLTLRVGAVPWISLALAASFGLYGLLRKTAHVESLAGLLVETLLTGPLALAYLVWLALHGQGAFPAAVERGALWLPLAGVLTATPLLLFAAAARRLRLATIGFLQYLTPTLHFALAVLVYGEPFTPAHMLTFILIWSGLALYTADAVRTFRNPAASRGEDHS
ncbi:EamA family transporter RarD [Geobacter sp. FeAm09]|uniref:EamA family transporter RarD n=1 Tax=Geobacter sp. FeAm09 TaxID=2597769 RepID=UPI0011EC9DBF|nr:EamA family transporter RarD [Geobacter sp. FeAm09]QEM69853.1 EamA family transporter RarD [Geobacter sp. FeAm09]